LNSLYFKNKILQLTDKDTHTFENLAMEVFYYQYLHNDLYRQYCSLIGKDTTQIHTITDIPFLPIQFFKNYAIQTKSWKSKTIFTSSGTTGANTSQHFVRDLNWYLQIARHGFEHFYGKIKNYCILGLLPAYTERTGSSLTAMVQDFVQRSKYTESGFFLYNFEDLITILKQNQQRNIPTLLIGVSFALLDLAERFPTDLKNIIVMETGGMKGRRTELTRHELHQLLKDAFNLSSVHSEYGMTELFSQGYSIGEGIFKPEKLLTR
jgi:phenylacetate-coenzyme A ligase PaaK-like adenylate-forming protein